MTKTGIVITVPKVNPDDLKCTCGADDNGYVPFWMHKPDCRRYVMICGGFTGTIFDLDVYEEYMKSQEEK